MKIYTKQGDEGKTSLVGGQKVDKDDLQVETYGTLDELNSHVGLLVSLLDGRDDCVGVLTEVQQNIFQLSSQMASAGYHEAFELSPKATELLEHEIDRLTALLPLRDAFIYPGGVQAAAQSHVCRTVCRRSERLVVRLSRTKNVGKESLRYLNRLSDYLFTLARYLNYKAGLNEKKWKSSCK